MGGKPRPEPSITALQHLTDAQFHPSVIYAIDSTVMVK